MKFKSSLFAILLSFSFITPAYADIQDRINSCERNNGGSCLYNLLRELSKNRGGRKGGSVLVTFYDDLNCSDKMGSANIRPRKAEATCRTALSSVSTNENIDSMKFGGNCLNLSNDQSDNYDLEQLVTFCSNNI